MKSLCAYALITAAAAFGSAGQAAADCVSATGEPVRSASGECWRTARWALVSTQVLFDFDGAELRADGRDVLDGLAKRLLAGKLESVAVTAHADRVGSASYNERLAARRADAIRAYLRERGVDERLMRVEARGEREPLTAGRCQAMGAEIKRNAKLVACLQPDRRVEIEVAGN